VRLALADAAALLNGVRRTTVLRLGLATAAVGLLAAAFGIAWGGEAGELPLAEAGKTTVLVLDVSSSIEPGQYRQIDDTLARGMREGGRFGVVLFSDVAYELLPPGTPAAELAGLRRYFTPLSPRIRGVETVAVGAVRFPKSPWSEVLTSGTRISTGLRLAAEMLGREGVTNGKVVLVSDLEDEYLDIVELGRVLAGYTDAGLPLRVVGLSPNPADERIFQRLIGSDAVERARPPRALRRADSGLPPEPFPAALVSAGLLLALVLGLNEHLLARLPLRPGEGTP
jgi:hypothetical protein